MRVLITAGATRNPVDAIRYLSANATGETGNRLSNMLTHSTILGSREALLRLGHDDQRTTRTSEEFTSTRDLMAKVAKHAPKADVIIHSAAVGDYEVFSDYKDGKIPSGQDEVILRLRPAPKILDHIRQWNPTCLLVSFKAAAPGTSPEDLVRIARAQLVRTGSNLVFANVIGEQDTSVQLVEAESAQAFATRDQAIVALVEWVKTRTAA